MLFQSLTLVLENCKDNLLLITMNISETKFEVVRETEFALNCRNYKLHAGKGQAKCDENTDITPRRFRVLNINNDEEFLSVNLVLRTVSAKSTCLSV